VIGEAAPVLVERPRRDVAVVSLNRPSVLNAMNAALVDRLSEVLDELDDDEGCRVVVLTGAGRAFCSGFDLNGYGAVDGVSEEGSSSRPEWTAVMQEHISRVIPKLRAMHQPVIAAVNGAAVGGGLGLALGADIRIASTSARFGVGFVRIGLSGCDVSVSWTLPKVVGVGMAHELMLTGRIVDADQALAMGLVTHVAPADALMEMAMGIAGEISANAPLGVAQTKRVMWAVLEEPTQRAAMELENRTQILLMQSDDYVEGRAAMREKRPPEFTGG
jgi:enoyl-CoA hydratase